MTDEWGDEAREGAEWLRNLAKNYVDGVPGMKPEDHDAWDIAKLLERLAAAPAAPPSGTTACPICGKDTPHYHPPEDDHRRVIAWICEIAQAVALKPDGDVWSNWQKSLTFDKPNVPAGSIRNLRPLFSAPSSPPDALARARAIEECARVADNAVIEWKDFAGNVKHTEPLPDRDIVARAIRALDAKGGGWQWAPKEATDAQLIAALEWALEWMKQHGVDGLSPFKDYPSPTETTRGMYRVMLATAPPSDPERGET